MTLNGVYCQNDNYCVTSLSNNGTTLIANDPTDSISTTSTDSSFILLCNANYPAGSSSGYLGVINLYYLYTPNMTGCVAACAEYMLAILSGVVTCDV